MTYRNPVPFWLSCLAIALVSLIAATVAHAADAVLKAPATFPACQLVLLEATGTKGDTVEWVCSDRDVRCWLSPDKLSAVVWAPGPRRSVFIIKATDKAGEKIAYVICDVTDGNAPQPAPGPMPDPLPYPDHHPNPPKPGRLGVGPGVFNEAIKIAHADRSKQAAGIADSLRTVQSQIKAGVIDGTKVSEVLRAITKSNQQLPAETRRTWIPWGQAWGVQVNKLHVDGKLKTSNDWCDLLQETADALKGL